MYFCSCEYNCFCNYRSSNRISLYSDKFLHNYRHIYFCMLLRKFWCIVYCIRSNIRFCNNICMMFRYTHSVPLRIVAIVM